jgi:hypothetical protein
MLLWLVLFFLIGALFMFIHKVIWKRKMEKTLGRKVNDRELTSISAWMDENPGDRKAE